MKILRFIGIILTLFNVRCETQIQAERFGMGAFLDSTLGAYLVSMHRIALWLGLQTTEFFQLKCPEGYLLGSGQLCFSRSQGPCSVVEKWTEIGNTGIGKCEPRMYKSPSPLFDQIPLNTHGPTGHVPGHGPGECWKCFIEGKTRTCCNRHKSGSR